jgi:hypothetical protein
MADHQLLSFPVVPDRRGNLTFIEGGEHVPFPIERVSTSTTCREGSRAPAMR